MGPLLTYLLTALPSIFTLRYPLEMQTWGTYQQCLSSTNSRISLSHNWDVTKTKSFYTHRIHAWYILPTFGCFFLANVGKYTKHGSYGIGLGFNAIKTMLEKAKIGLGSPQQKIELLSWKSKGLTPPQCQTPPGNQAMRMEY